MKITSVFAPYEKIPSRYTSDGENVSPSLAISEIPSDAKTIALIVDDPDAPSRVWVHWVVFNIPIEGDEIEIKEGASPGVDGENDFRESGYGGPSPPSGTHRYFFKVYALDASLQLKKGATKSELVNAMKGHVIDEAELVGVYSKKNF